MMSHLVFLTELFKAVDSRSDSVGVSGGCPLVVSGRGAAGVSGGDSMGCSVGGSLVQPVLVVVVGIVVAVVAVAVVVKVVVYATHPISGSLESNAVDNLIPLEIFSLKHRQGYQFLGHGEHDSLPNAALDNGFTHSSTFLLKGSPLGTYSLGTYSKEAIDTVGDSVLRPQETLDPLRR
eukprot:gene12724-biopygen11612